MFWSPDNIDSNDEMVNEMVNEMINEMVNEIQHRQSGIWQSKEPLDQQIEVVLEFLEI